MTKVRAERPRLAEMVERSAAGETFLVPAPLCFPVTRETHDNGSALRVLYGMLWISSEILRTGAPVGVGASLAEIRIAAGFESYGKDIPVAEALPLLEQEYCDLQDGGRIRIFDKLSLSDDTSRSVEWVFNTEFQELFVSPRVFAIVSISEIVNLKSGLDFFLYLQVRRIWKMQKKAVTLSISDLGKASGLGEKAPFRRISERIKRTSRRLENLLYSDILLKPSKSPGERRFGEVKVEIKARM